MAQVGGNSDEEHNVDVTEASDDTEETMAAMATLSQTSDTTKTSKQEPSVDITVVTNVPDPMDEVESYLVNHHTNLSRKSDSYRKVLNLSKVDLVRKDLAAKFSEFMSVHKPESDAREDIRAFYEDLLKAEGSADLYNQVNRHMEVPASSVIACFQARTANQKLLLKTHKELLRGRRCELYSQFCDDLGDRLVNRALLKEFRKYRAQNPNVSTAQAKNFVEKNFKDLIIVSDNFV